MTTRANERPPKPRFRRHLHDPPWRIEPISHNLSFYFAPRAYPKQGSATIVRSILRAVPTTAPAPYSDRLLRQARYELAPGSAAVGGSNPLSDLVSSPKRVYHLVTRSLWECEPGLPYRAASLEAEGFIHCSFADQVVALREPLFCRRDRSVGAGTRCSESEYITARGAGIEWAIVSASVWSARAVAGPENRDDAARCRRSLGVPSLIRSATIKEECRRDARLIS